MKNRIKTYSVLLLVIFLSFSCEEVVDVAIPENPPRLVIEATFNRYFNDNNGQNRSEGNVRLTLTAPFFEDQIPPALGARVFIEDTVNGRLYEFFDIENNGNYFTNFVPEFDIDYILTINFEGETYTASTRMMPTGKIENAIQGDKTLFNEDDKEVVITLLDTPDERNFYFLDLDFGNFLITDDEFYDGNAFEFSYFYEDLVVGDQLVITAFGIDKNFADFFENIQTQSGDDGGTGPFSTPPVIVRGNVINSTNPKNFPFGYFRISEGTDIELTITR